MRWTGPMWALCFLLCSASASTRQWDYVVRAGSRRSEGCQKNAARGQECVCLGTENSRNEIRIGPRRGHYERLAKSFVRCRRVIGNLELTHINQPEIAAFGAPNGTDSLLLGPFSFLEHLEEITGYLLVFNVNVSELALPRLKVIWGERLHEGNALQVDSNPNLRVLSMPSLRAIESGSLSIKSSPTLCYMDPGRDFVAFSEILGHDPQNGRRLYATGAFSRNCAKVPSCDRRCSGNCFGPGADQCQTIYRRGCEHCESGACFLDGDGVRKCCDDACAGGCQGEGADKCVACKKFEQDGRCVSECRGIRRYNPAEKQMEWLAEAERRYSYGRHCVRECPSGSLVEDAHCVTRCSPGKYRNESDHCVPCPSGVCPKVCQLEEPIDALNIRRLVNCTEIEGNIEILNHVFEEHSHILGGPISLGADGSLALTPLENASIPALNASQLDVLRSVRVLSGSLIVDGGHRSSKLKPRSLEFLENLEVIEGRKLYFEKYSLYVIGNPDLRWLGLRSLKRIKNGLVSVSYNKKLCYSYTVPFKRHFGVRESVWRNNSDEQLCERTNRKCDSNCDAALGCWGPGPGKCVQCSKFKREEDNLCAEECPRHGYFTALSPHPTGPQSCMRCHEQCAHCSGPSALDCDKCRNFELWIRPTAGLRPADQIVSVQAAGALRKCVAKCPNETYVLDGHRCEPCHRACRSGCTGPEAHIGPNGCNQCQYAVERAGRQLTCLLGEEPDNAVCGEKNGLGPNFYIQLAQSLSVTKYLCRECRPECQSCTGDTVLMESRFGSLGCVCAHFQMQTADAKSERPTECAMECGRGSRLLAAKNETSTGVGLCQQCHPLCDARFSCDGPGPARCERCAHGGVVDHENGTIQCLAACPADFPFVYEGLCRETDVEEERRQKARRWVFVALGAFALFASIIAVLAYRCVSYQKKYVKEVQMHMPEIPSLDPMKVTQRPNMRCLNLIQIDELSFSGHVLGQGAFGIVYAGKWKPPGFSQFIPVAIKAINSDEQKYVNEKEMLREAGIMHTLRHEHLLPVAGICLGGSGLRIVTLLRPVGSLLAFLKANQRSLRSKQLMLYCYQIASAMEYLAKKNIVHRDLAARNVLVRRPDHVEVTDFGLAAMLQRPGDSIVVDGRVAVKWLALESLRCQVYNQKTDVWSFGVTCWEILTFGEAPYKDLQLRRERMAVELADKLERGYRLRQPANCSQELYQELLNCWLIDPESRLSFAKIKHKFEQFCRAPHIYIQDRQAAYQRLNSLDNADQRAMIERLLRDNDFLDPVNIDPAEYQLGSASPGTETTECFFSSPATEAQVRATSPARKNGTNGRRPMRLGSTGTSSTRYKSEPGNGHKRLSLSESTTATAESPLDGRESGEEHYLIPHHRRLAALGRSIEESAEEDYTPVVDVEGPTAEEYVNQRGLNMEYANGTSPSDLISLSPSKAHDGREGCRSAPKRVVQNGYVNAQSEVAECEAKG